MSEEKLNLQQKLFAVIEGLVRETKIQELHPDIPAAVEELSFAIKTTTHSQAFQFPARTQALDTTIPAETVEIVQSFLQPQVTDAAISALQAAAVDENVAAVRDATVYDAPVQLTTDTVDFFSRFQINPNVKYTTTVKDVDFTGLKVGKPRSLNISVYPILRNNLELFKRFPVEKRPVILSFVSEEEQLHYWKKAVIKTRKEPRQLELVGVYTGIPRQYIENIRINFSNRCLNYNFKTTFDIGINLRAKKEPLKDMAVFQDLETGKSIMVSK